jgi:predicted flap endonuclease-1-like 5' DNA nuclease
VWERSDGVVYLITQMALTVAVAVLLGAALGWALWGKSRNRLLLQLEAHREKIESLMRSHELIGRELEGATAARAAWEQSLANAEVQIDQAVAAKGTAEEEIVRLETELAGKKAELAASADTVESLRDQVTQLEQELTRHERSPVPATEQVSQRPKEYGAPRKPPMPMRPGSEGSEYDDLTAIYGIGRVLEARLNQEGVFYYRQLAEWTEQDVERFSLLLKNFSDRIRRDRWVELAREEHWKKYGERIGARVQTAS